MSHTEIEQRCIALIAQAKQVPADTVTPASTFEELAIDSLDKVSLAFDIEEAYNISIPESALSSIKSVEDMANGIEKILDEKSNSLERAQ